MLPLEWSRDGAGVFLVITYITAIWFDLMWMWVMVDSVLHGKRYCLQKIPKIGCKWRNTKQWWIALRALREHFLFGHCSIFSMRHNVRFGQVFKTFRAIDIFLGTQCTSSSWGTPAECRIKGTMLCPHRTRLVGRGQRGQRGEVRHSKADIVDSRSAASLQIYRRLFLKPALFYSAHFPTCLLNR